MENMNNQEPGQSNQQNSQQADQLYQQVDYAYRQAGQGYGKGPIGEIRNPVTMLLLSIFTCGIYGIYWQYKVSQEINEYTRSELTLPSFVIAGIFCGIFGWINVYKIDQAVVAIDQIEGRHSESKFLIWLLLTLVAGVGLFMMVYQVQESLNRIWISNVPSARNPNI